MKNYGQGLSKTEIAFLSLEKKKNLKQSPDISKMQVVEIDGKTKIYIAQGASADDARTRYFEHIKNKKF